MKSIILIFISSLLLFTACGKERQGTPAIDPNDPDNPINQKLDADTVSMEEFLRHKYSKIVLTCEAHANLYQSNGKIKKKRVPKALWNVLDNYSEELQAPMTLEVDFNYTFKRKNRKFTSKIQWKEVQLGLQKEEIEIKDIDIKGNELIYNVKNIVTATGALNFEILQAGSKASFPSIVYDEYTATSYELIPVWSDVYHGPNQRIPEITIYGSCYLDTTVNPAYKDDLKTRYKKP